MKTKDNATERPLNNLALNFVGATVFMIVMAGCGGMVGAKQSQTVDLDENEPTKIAVPEPEEVKNEIPITRTIGSDRRKAVFLECYYALRQGWLYPPNESGPFGGNQINGCVVGDWGYLASDTNAYNYVVSRIGRSNASISSENMLSSNYMLKAGKERTGQCLFFSVLILRRALSYDLPVSWSSYKSTEPSARNAVPGDVVFYKHANGSNHIGICVMKTAEGIDVVDSNYVGSGTYPVKSGYSSSEVLGRHWVSNSVIDSKQWKVYSGRGRWYN